MVGCWGRSAESALFLFSLVDPYLLIFSSRLRHLIENSNFDMDRGDVRDGTSGTGVRSLSPRFQPAAGENFF